MADSIKKGTSFDELMFTELRMVSFADSDSELNEKSLITAMTVNNELINIGYTLSPKDVIRLSRSNSLYSFFDHVKSLVGDVKAPPMYPNFPKQVMELTEAQFRFHQMLHYMSTYGIEMIMDTPVKKGWLPNPDKKEKPEKDTRLLDSKVIGLVSEYEKYIYSLSKVLRKAERLTDKELLLVKSAVENCTAEQLTSLNVPFKQNLFELFYSIFSNEDTDSYKKLSALKAICIHSGDVWKCLDYTITRCHYHLRTSQKRIFVKLLELYPLNDFRANLILSNKKAERIKSLLPFISFNTLSRSPEHKSAVASLRNKELRSWTSGLSKLIETNPEKALEYLSVRPGELLRRVNHLIKRGCPTDKIEDVLVKNADKLSIQTLVTVINKFSKVLSKYSNFDANAELPNINNYITFDDDFEYSNDYTAEEYNNYRAEYAEEIARIKARRAEYIAKKEAKRAEVSEMLDKAELIYNICTTVLAERLKSVETGMEGKKVYLDLDRYNLDFSVINCNEKSKEGGYVRSGLAYRLPENVDRLRFFVYWNDKRRVDIDLHAEARDIEDKNISIGWNTEYKTEDCSIIFSGDITHSDAAEYIDFDVNSDIKEISANINIYSGKNTFKEIEEVYVGIMAVDKIGEKVKLYSSENCFFSHYLTSKCRTINYGYIDVQNRCLIFVGDEVNAWNCYVETNHCQPVFSLGSYLDMLTDAKNITIVDNRNAADIVLIMEKASKDNEISLIDSNFFM
ncbi:MAG: hypothetical protein K2O36_02635 [Ruminococcus sp.]|nr:hypothetical protein [Ruminococcus sp.]